LELTAEENAQMEEVFSQFESFHGDEEEEDHGSHRPDAEGLVVERYYKQYLVWLFEQNPELMKQVIGKFFN